MSKMKFKAEAVYSEKYTDKEGQEKTKYTNIGALFEREDGSLCAKILGSWVNFYPPKMKEDGYKAAKQAVAPLDDPSDDVPW